MKKKTFLLLEVLIALCLVSLWLIPFIKRPLAFYRSELNRLEELEKERLADWTFTEVKEMLLKNEIPWKNFPDRGDRSDDFVLPDVTMQLPLCKPKVIHRRFFLTGRGWKTGKDGQDYRQLGIFITLDQTTYPFRLPAQKIFVAK